MNENLQNARNLLESGDYTCVVCRNDLVYTTSQRGVAPLLHWLVPIWTYPVSPLQTA